MSQGSDLERKGFRSMIIQFSPASLEDSAYLARNFFRRPPASEIFVYRYKRMTLAADIDMRTVFLHRRATLTTFPQLQVNATSWKAG